MSDRQYVSRIEVEVDELRNKSELPIAASSIVWNSDAHKLIKASTSDLEAKLDAEITNRINGDQVLQEALDSEAIIRANADTALQADIDAEVARATAKEADIEQQLAGATVPIVINGTAPNRKIELQHDNTLVVTNDELSIPIDGVTLYIDSSDNKLKSTGSVLDVQVMKDNETTYTSIVGTDHIAKLDITDYQHKTISLTPITATTVEGALTEIADDVDDIVIQLNSEGLIRAAADTALQTALTAEITRATDSEAYMMSWLADLEADKQDNITALNPLQLNAANDLSLLYDGHTIILDSAGLLTSAPYTGDEGISVDQAGRTISVLYDDSTVKLKSGDNTLYVPIDNDSIKVVNQQLQVYDVKAIGGYTSNLKSLIADNTVSGTNYLVTLDELNDKIASNLGTFRGTGTSLPTIQSDWKNNDYCYLQQTDSGGNMYLFRYKLVKDSSGTANWSMEYQLTLSTFTSSQWKTLNCGADSGIITNTVNHYNDSGKHVTAADKTTWNSKQDTLTAGTNVSITSNTIAALDEKVTPLAGGSAEVLVAGNGNTNSQPYTATGVTAGNGNITLTGNLTASGTVTGNKVVGAVWNDYAEYRLGLADAGRCVIETGDGDLILSTDRLQPAPNIVSDTFGFAIGETERAKLPIAVSGRVLAYPFEDRRAYKAGDAVCSGPYGTVSIMSREEIINYPDRIVGIVSEIPNYEKWGSGDIAVNGRIWIKVR